MSTVPMTADNASEHRIIDNQLPLNGRWGREDRYLRVNPERCFSMADAYCVDAVCELHNTTCDKLDEARKEVENQRLLAQSFKQQALQVTDERWKLNDELNAARKEIAELKRSNETLLRALECSGKDRLALKAQVEQRAPISDRDRIEWMVQLASAAMSAGNTYISPEGRANDAKVRLEAIIDSGKEQK